MKILSVLFSKKTIIQYFLHLCFFISYFLTPSDIIEPNKIEIPKDESSGIVKLPESLNEAYKAGVKAEIENIAMYERFLQQELPKDVRQVFESLKNASENHLRAFRRFSEN